MKLSSWPVIVACGVIAVGGAVFALKYSGHKFGDGKALNERPSARVFKVGRTTTYDIRITQRIELGQQSFDFAVDGKFALTVEREQPVPRLSARFLEADTRVIQGSSTQGITECDADLKLGVTFDTLADGGLNAVDDSKIKNVIARQFMRTAVGITNFAVPPASIAESDATGRYKVTYTWAEGNGAFLKSYNGYEEVFVSGAANVKLAGKLTGEARGRVDFDAWPSELSGTTTALVDIPGQSSLQSKTTTTFEAKALTSGVMAASGSAPRRGSASTTSAGAGSQGETESSAVESEAVDPWLSFAQRRLQGKTLNDIESASRSIPETGEKHDKAHHQIYLDMKAYVKLNQTNLAPLKEKLVGQRAAGTSFYDASMTALANDGCDECQKILADELRQSLGDSEAAIFLLALASTPKNPEENIEAAVRKLLESDPDPVVRGDARLALGAIAGRLRDRDQSRAEKIVAENLEKLRGAGDDERRLLIDALGNSGSPQITAVVEPMLADQSNAVRAHAVDSLRFVSSPAAKEAIVKRFDDSSEDVRTAAITSFSYRALGKDDRALLIKRIGEDPSPSVRRAALASLANYASDPITAAAITKAESDSDESVRNTARSISASTRYERR